MYWETFDDCKPFAFSLINNIGMQRGKIYVPGPKDLEDVCVILRDMSYKGFDFRDDRRIFDLINTPSHESARLFAVVDKFPVHTRERQVRQQSGGGGIPIYPMATDMGQLSIMTYLGRPRSHKKLKHTRRQ